MRITATCLSLSPPTAAVHFQPHWLSRALAAATGGLFGCRSYTRHAQQLYPGSTVWVWSDTLIAVDDRSYVAVIDAHINALIAATVDKSIAAFRRAMDAVTALSPVDEQLN